MRVLLSQNEIIEAVHEWCEKRGIPSKDCPIEIHAERIHATGQIKFFATVDSITMPPKEGPYR